MAVYNFIIPTIKVVHNSRSRIYSGQGKVFLISYISSLRENITHYCHKINWLIFFIFLRISFSIKSSLSTIVFIFILCYPLYLRGGREGGRELSKDTKYEREQVIHRPAKSKTFIFYYERTKKIYLIRNHKAGKLFERASPRAGIEYSKRC